MRQFDNVLERYGVNNVAPSTGPWSRTGGLVPSFSSDETVERLRRALDVEPGYFKTAIVNA